VAFSSLRLQGILFEAARMKTNVTTKRATLFAAALLIFLSGSAHGETVGRTVRGPSDKDIRVGLYINVQPDCSSGPLPTIRLVTPPSNGKVTVKRGNVRATNYKQCLALEVPGFIALYHSAPGFSGVDTLTIEVKYPGGRTETQRIMVTVGGGRPDQKI
jgi:hypothetical protein